MITKPEKDSNEKVKGEFYPLHNAELIALHKAKLINNAAFVHLALRSENPYCDVLRHCAPRNRPFNLTKLALAEAACSEFAITVTFEEVQP